MEPLFLKNEEWYEENYDRDPYINYFLTEEGKKNAAVVNSYISFFLDDLNPDFENEEQAIKYVKEKLL